jgi:lipopolysaccharide assembly outer membrane protein LptD (OstA)
MKLATAAVLLCALGYAAQDNPSDPRKHISIPTTTNVRPVLATAAEIERGTEYPSIIHLRGNVEIRTPMCVATGPGTALSCGGYVVVRADRADVKEDTGDIEATGNVRITREK